MAKIGARACPLSIDDMMKAVIETMPDHFAPDEQNEIVPGLRYKAPDHSAFNGYLLIERKSRADPAHNKISRRLDAIAQEQGWRGGAYGMVRTDRMIADFPDPVSANREITDYALRQLLKQLKEANRKFREYEQHNPCPHSVRIVVVSDHSTQPGGNAADEAFIGRKMGAHSASEDVVESVDAVLLAKHPRFTFDEDNSYWLKCLVRGRLDRRDRDNVIDVASTIHNALVSSESFASDIYRVRSSNFRALIV